MKKKLELSKNNSFGILLDKEIKKKFKNQSIFADKIGVTQATVSRYITGNALPSFQILKKISTVLNIDLGLVNNSNEDIKSNNKIIKIPFFYSEVSAGKGVEALADSYEMLSFDEVFLKNQFFINNTNDIFAVKVKGDSMEPNISEGDIVFAQKYLQQPSSHGIYIVCYNDEYFIKKIQFKSKEILKLISSNKDYDPIEIILSDPNTSFVILAKVLGRINIKNFTPYSLHD